MKKIFLLLAFLVAMQPFAFSQPSDLIISEYVEGSSLNKAIELYNGTDETIDLGAAAYTIQIYFNGSTTPSNISLSGTVAAKTAFVIAHTSAVLGVTPNQSSSNLTFNGDDAVVLKKGGATGTVVDVIGQVGTDPGAEWGAGEVSTSDNTIRRKPSVCIGKTNTSETFDPTSQWIGFPLNTFSGLGSHETSCSAVPGISTTPDSLRFTMASVQSYNVKGTSLTEDILVTAPSGFEVSLSPAGTFSSSIVILLSLANSENTTVYVKYIPGASPSSGLVSNVSGGYTKDVKVYGAVAEITPIYEIQGSGNISPKAGMLVTTEGVVTRDFQGEGQFGGFFIQTVVGDNNAGTSDGIFISNTSFAVAEGDVVRLS